MCPLFLANESGYFADAGFDVEIVKEFGTSQSLPLLAGGKLDASLTAFGPPVVNAVVRGARVRVVAGREVISPTCGTAGTIFLSPKTFPKGAGTMRQLKGASIAVSGQSPQSGFWLEALLRNEGMRISDVVMRKMPEIQRMAAVRAGAVDGFISTEADIGAEVRLLGLLAGPRVSSVLPNYQFSHILFGSRLLDGPVETGARLLRAYLRGAGDFLRGRTPRFLEEYAKGNNIDPKPLREGCRETFERDGSIHLDDLRRYTGWMAARGMCPAVDAMACVDTRFLDAAHALK